MTKLTTQKSYILRAPAEGQGLRPIVVSCPHAGVDMPDDFKTAIAVNPFKILQRTDLYTEQMAAIAPSLGIVQLISQVAPGYLNVGRPIDAIHPDEIHGDPGDLVFNPEDPTVKDNLGKGLVASKTLYEGLPVYPDGSGPSAADVKNRIDTYYSPYHDALQFLVKERLEQHGYCFIFDMHSCISDGKVGNADIGKPRPDVILGNVYGQSCDDSLLDELEQAALDSGFTVARNDPYEGGYITQHYGAHSDTWGPAGCESVQIEFTRRAIGVDDDTLKIENFEQFEKAQKLASKYIEICADYADQKASPSP